MKKIMLVFGTRPEAIKMCPLVQALRQRRDRVQTIVCVTGQHKQMLQQVLQAFQVTPEYDLSVMQQEQTLLDVTTGVLKGMGPILQQEKPDLVLVHGDTTTAFATALACFYQQIPVGHVEAGLRTYDFTAPYPEELNRQVVDLISRYYFAPTQESKENLLREGKPEEAVFVTGNTAIDALKTTVQAAYSHPDLQWADGSKLILLTAHRRENWGRPMRRMFRAVRRIVEAHSDVKVIYPVHMNPVVRKLAEEELAGLNRVRLIEPLDVLDFHNFMAKAYLVLTDSGGVQEEAPALGKPVLVMRDVTERPEGVAAGTLKLVGTEEQAICAACHALLTDEKAYEAMARAKNPYGDGTAARQITEILLEHM